MRTIANVGMRTRLIAVVVATVIPLGVVCALVLRTALAQSIEGRNRQQLRQDTEAIVGAVELAARASVRNRLRGITEKNLELLHYIWKGVREGRISGRDAEAQMRELLLSQTIGETGYIYCIDSKGMFVVHPKKEVVGTAPTHREFIQEQLKQKTGYLEYQWKNPGEARERKKALYMGYFAPKDWIVSVSSYRDEFNHLVEINDIRSFVSNFDIAGGYSFVSDYDGRLLVHPHYEGRKLASLEGESGRAGQRIQTMREGELIYKWQSPGAPVRDKFVVFRSVPSFSWIVGTNCHIEQLKRPLGTVNRVILLIFLILLIVSGIALAVVGTQMLSPVLGMQKQLSSFDGKDLSFRMPERGTREIRDLIHVFNGFMGRLESSDQELRHQEQLVEDSNRMLRLVLDTIPVRVFWKDKDLKYLGCNRLFAQDAGLSSAEDLVGKTDIGLHWHDGAAMFQGATESVDGAIELQLAYEEMVPLSDGTMRCYRKNKVPLTGRGDEIIGVLGTYEDISDEKAAARKLAESEQRYRKLYENAPFGIALFRGGLMVDANRTAEQILGRNRKALIGRTPLAWSPRTQNGIESARQVLGFVQAAEKDEQQTFEWKALRGRQEVDLRVSVVAVEVDSQPHLLAFFQDITQQKQNEEKLRTAQKMTALGQLAHGVARDFNNSLSGIIASVQLLQRQADDPALKRFADLALKSASQAVELSRDLISLSGKDRKKVVPVDIRKSIKQSVRLLRHGLNPDISIETDVHSGNTTVAGDPALLQNLLLNLGINACEAMPGGGTLRILTHTQLLDEKQCSHSNFDLAPGHYVCVCVWDTGSGMTDSTRSRIFEPFFTTKENGRGMGLAIAYGIVLEHHGAIQVESKLGIGTSIEVLLPLTAETVNTTEEELVRGSGRILIAEDDDNLRRSTAMVLEEIGYSVIACESGRDALEEYKKADPPVSLVLTDMVMPGMSGPDLFYAVRSLDPDIPVVGMTGFEQKKYDDSISRMTGFIHKPFSLVELSRTIASSLTQSYSAETPATSPEIPTATPLDGSPKALVVDEDSVLREALVSLLVQRGYDARGASSKDDALETVKDGPVDILVVARQLTGTDGFELVARMRQAAEYVLMTAERRSTDAVHEATQAGVHDFLQKPFPLDLFLTRIGVAEAHIRNARKRAEAERLLRELNEDLENRVLKRTAEVEEAMNAQLQAEDQTRMQREQLLQAEKLASLGTLVAGIGHEINNPTHFIMLNLPLLKGAWESAVPILEEYHRSNPDLRLRGIPFELARQKLPVLYDDIMVGAQRIKKIIAELKDYAKPTQGEKTAVAMKRIIEAAQTLLAPTIRKHTHNFSATVQDELPEITANATQIEQVVINLVQNACLSLPSPDAAVRLSCSRAGDEVVVTVADEGCGIPKDHLPKLTDPFFTTRLAEGGTGLGLAICLRIISDHDGRIAFQSQKGKGTTVTVHLPLSREGTNV